MKDKPTIASSHNHIECVVDGLTRTEFLDLYKRSWYGAESSTVEPPSYPDGSLIKVCDFENEADFQKEHERIASLAKSINPHATVRSFYYPANEETSLYRHAS
jgi:hypothetical protein